MKLVLISFAAMLGATALSFGLAVKSFKEGGNGFPDDEKFSDEGKRFSEVKYIKARTLSDNIPQ